MKLPTRTSVATYMERLTEVKAERSKEDIKSLLDDIDNDQTLSDIEKLIMSNHALIEIVKMLLDHKH